MTYVYPFRQLTAYEQMVMRFMNRQEYTKCHLIALANARTASEFEAVLRRAIDRYEDWISD